MVVIGVVSKLMEVTLIHRKNALLPMAVTYCE
jgi:hypothetical protein